MSFFSALFGGSSPEINSSLSNTGKLAGFSSGQGQANTTAGSGFFNSILSGDSTKIASALAPAISAGQQGVQQQKQQIANFSNRSGGSTAKVNSLDSANRGNIINMVGGMQSGAASTLLSSGQSLLGTALGGYSQQADLAQKQMDNWSNSIFGGLLGGIGGNAGQAITGGLGKIPGLSAVL